MGTTKRAADGKASALNRVPPEVRRRIIDTALYLYENDRQTFDALAALVARLRPRR